MEHEKKQQQLHICSSPGTRRLVSVYSALRRGLVPSTTTQRHALRLLAEFLVAHSRPLVKMQNAALYISICRCSTATNTDTLKFELETTIVEFIIILHIKYKTFTCEFKDILYLLILQNILGVYTYPESLILHVFITAGWAFFGRLLRTEDFHEGAILAHRI